ncbi:unnamed protein product [Medioppia subpectinata]|uniref:Malonyl-CoA:ACP transacylase (MAT) domain-containing protein n=1 Tax=Medioppia subpectinata TaxID=1979941 RepID=A0A7R9KCB9_9ACAR|nr:unnamed protein product [Medioppia subpectinata]CAG2100876.1 unnamed protein product [Medioppia subpectinata]
MDYALLLEWKTYRQTFLNTSNEGIGDQYMDHNSQHNSVNIDYTEPMDKMLSDVSYAAIIDTEPEAQESGAQSGRQLQQQSRLVVVSGRSQRIVQNILDFGFGGDRKADDQLRTLLDNAFEGKSRTNGSNRVTDDDLWRGFAVFTRTTDGNRFQQISRHIARQSAQNKPSIWFMFSAIRPGIARSVPALMTIPAFKASVEVSAQLLSPLGVDAIECLTDTTDWMTAFSKPYVHRVLIATIVHHMAFVDTLKAVGITADGYLGASLGELMCLYMDGLCDRRQCLAICRAFRPPAGPHPLWSLRATNAWPEIRSHCANRPDICVSTHFADTFVIACGTEAAVRQLRDVLPDNKVVDVGPKHDYMHAGNAFAPDMGQALVDQFTKVVPERTRTKPSQRWLFTTEPTLPMANTGGGANTGFSAAECLANTALSPILLMEAIDRLPADALVVYVKTDSRLRDVVLSGRPQELYVKESVESTPESVFGINHLLREIGLVFTAGHWPRVHDLVKANNY